MTLSEILFIVAGIAAIVYYWCKHNYSHWQRKGIPYIKPKPLIGNMDVIFSMKTSFGMYLSDIYNEQSMSTEPVVGIYALNKPGLVVRAPELIKSILIKDFYKFSNRYVAADPHGDALGSYNLFFVKNPHWKEIRTKLTPVFTSGKIKQMYPLMLEVAKDLETHLSTYERKENTFVTEVKEICSLFTTDLIATIAFGLRANSLINPNGEFRKHGRKQFDFTLSRSMDFFVAFFLPKLVSLLRVKVFGKEFSKFLRDTINYVMLERQRSATTRNDLIDILVSLKQEAALEPKGKHYAQNNDFLVAQAAVFLTAGFETSSSTMAFALYELAKRPDLQQRLRREICEALVADKGCLSYDKINSLEYLGMVVDEVLRLYPVLPFLDREYISAKGEPDFTLKPYYGCDLSPGTPVFIPIFALQRDPKYWPNPDVFDPERFSSENRKLIQPMTYLPFGTGPRNCIGSRIGLLQAKIGLVHFLKNHYVKPCEKTMNKMIFDPLAFILQCKSGVHLSIVNDRMYEIVHVRMCIRRVLLDENN